jgi:hypothetical protein
MLTLFAKNLFDQNFAGSVFRYPIWPSAATIANVDALFAKESDRYFGANVRVRF